MNRIKLAQHQIDHMRAHVESCLPLEACGLLAGNGEMVTEVLVIGNRARSPVRFQMDALEQLHAFHWMENHGVHLLGIFHSHPDGPEGPSVTDIAEAAYTVAQLIWSHQQGLWKVRGFWIENGCLSDVKLDVAVHM